jgi:hypothetical protein
MLVQDAESSTIAVAAYYSKEAILLARDVAANIGI